MTDRLMSTRAQWKEERAEMLRVYESNGRNFAAVGRVYGMTRAGARQRIVQAMKERTAEGK